MSLKNYLIIAGLGIIGWVMFILAMAYILGLQRNQYPCAWEESKSRTYLRCTIRGEGIMPWEK